MDTRLRAARGLAKNGTEASVEALTTLKRRGHPEAPPPLASDGWGGHREAMVEVWGEVPEYGGRGRPPTRKQPGEGWQHLQVVKERDNGRVTSVRLEVPYGDRDVGINLLGESIAYGERTHLTMRQMNGRFVRKGLGFSKKFEMLRASRDWDDLVYNLCRAVKTLRIEAHESPRRWVPRSPAMAAGLTDHIWTTEELLTKIPIPNT